MNKFSQISLCCALMAVLLMAATSPASAQISDADRRMMETMPADEDGWAGVSDGADFDEGDLPVSDADANVAPEFHNEEAPLHPLQGARPQTPDAPVSNAP